MNLGGDRAKYYVGREVPLTWTEILDPTEGMDDSHLEVPQWSCRAREELNLVQQ